MSEGGEMMAVVVLGGTTFDLLATGLDTLPMPSGDDEFTARSLAFLPATPVASIGGNAGNTAFALARLGCAVRVVTPIADDFYGHTLLAWLRDAGCEVERLPCAESSVNFVATDTAGRRISFFRPVDIPADVALDLQSGDQLLLTGYPHADDETLLRCARQARAAGAATYLDIGPSLAGFDSDRIKPLVPLLHTLFANRAELAGVDVHTEMVIKDGANGAVHLDRDGNSVAVPAFQVPVKSTVGAGDVFNAGYLCADGAPVRDRLRFAAATAALMLSHGRGSSKTPTRSEVNTFLNGEQP